MPINCTHTAIVGVKGLIERAVPYSNWNSPERPIVGLTSARQWRHGAGLVWWYGDARHTGDQWQQRSKKLLLLWWRATAGRSAGDEWRHFVDWSTSDRQRNKDISRSDHPQRRPTDRPQMMRRQPTYVHWHTHSLSMTEELSLYTRTSNTSARQHREWP